MTGSMTGKVFNNRYQITERIGIGGMAEVYRAQDNVLGRMVAVKTMLPQYAADENFTKRFRQEAAAAANLQSPYIVNVYDWGQDDGTYYIVMEFVRGSDLKTAINERGAINQRKVAEIGAQVCQALSVAHKLDIIHRDIKPQNIMVQPDGNVKVMDFGIARAKNSVMTQTSSVLGTAHYISPEQAQGKELTAASDIYSLGVVMYEAVSGKLPFDGPDAVSVAMKQVNDLPMPLHEAKPDIDPSLEAIIMKAMAKNPSDRFATAQDMRYALNDYLTGRPVNVGGSFAGAETAVIGTAGAAGAVGNAGTPLSNNANATAVMPVSPANGINGTNTSIGTGTPKNYRANDGGPSNKKIVAIVIGVIAALAVVGGLAFALMGGLGGESGGVAVPDVKGKSQDDAAQLIKSAGFVVGNVETVPDDEVEEGKVVDQDPKAGTQRAKGTEVNLVISGGASKTSVPDLKGKTAEEARKLLSEKGLEAEGGDAMYSDDVDKDKVAGQSITAGTTVPKGTVITYYLSLGSEGSAVPSVIGETQGSATAILKNAGFQVTTENAYNDTVEYGYVIDQTPKEGERLKKGSTVNIVVSLGPDPSKEITIPWLIGSTVGSAKAQLQNLGFTVYMANNAADSATVVDMSPAGGSTAAKGSTITLYGQSSYEPTPDPEPTPNPDTGTNPGTGGGQTQAN